ncbi:hypothetical protein D3C86_2049790 [compost metagenome]
MPVITSKQPGDVVTVKVKRDGIEKDIKITLKASPNIKLVAEIQSNAPESQVLVRKGWMGI